MIQEMICFITRFIFCRMNAQCHSEHHFLNDARMMLQYPHSLGANRVSELNASGGKSFGLSIHVAVKKSLGHVIHVDKNEAV